MACPQVFCVFLFLCAASLFGTIIAQVNEIVADLTTKKKDLDRILEAYLALNPRCLNYELYPKTVLHSGALLSFFFSRLDINTIFKVRTWERFQFMIDFEAKQVF
jgi:hypothetical protein